MKTTSYEISKKLFEIGFKADCYFAYHSELEELHSETIYNRYYNDAIYYPAYDLETILGELPEFVKIEEIPNYLSFGKIKLSRFNMEKRVHPITRERNY